MLIRQDRVLDAQDALYHNWQPSDGSQPFDDVPVDVSIDEGGVGSRDSCSLGRFHHALQIFVVL